MSSTADFILFAARDSLQDLAGPLAILILALVSGLVNWLKRRREKQAASGPTEVPLRRAAERSETREKRRQSRDARALDRERRETLRPQPVQPPSNLPTVFRTLLERIDPSLVEVVEIVEEESPPPRAKPVRREPPRRVRPVETERPRTEVDAVLQRAAAARRPSVRSQSALVGLLGLNDVQSIRRAIVLSEILGPPVALRDRTPGETLWT
jgi:hypothetical protein